MLAKLLRAVSLVSFVVSTAALAAHVPAGNPIGKRDPRLAGAYRFERGGWTYVHLQGSPEQIGFQHGYLLAPQIADYEHVLEVEAEHSTHRDWEFYREAGRKILWPHIDAEYRSELRGIAEGVKARGLDFDLWDIVAMNGDIELTEYYVPWLDKHLRAANASHDPKAPGNCSAFIATGSYTKGGKIVMAHNNWSSYAEGERWVIVFDIKPTHGYHILMDGAPGVITSDDDFGVNSAGIMVTETTISGFVGWDSDGIPEFVRSRKALQYADSIDQYAAIMRKGNNGGYANDWLIGDRKTGEIAYLELGLKHAPLWRTKNGYFVSSNFPRDPAVIKDETVGYDPKDMASSPNARHVRWVQLMKQYKGKIDVPLAEKFLSDHEDSYLHKVRADQRSLCGHVDVAKQGVPVWGWGPYYPGGAVQGKATDSDMAAKLSFVARAGHPCGENFYVKPFLKAHPQYAWETPILKDMIAGPWTTFHAGEK